MPMTLTIDDKTSNLIAQLLVATAIPPEMTPQVVDLLIQIKTEQDNGTNQNES